MTDAQPSPALVDAAGALVERANRCVECPQEFSWDDKLDLIRDMAIALHPSPTAEGGTLPMVLYCPACGYKHIDTPEPGWDNPPHRSHLCGRCGIVWRPADVPTNGVARIETRGSADTWDGSGSVAEVASTPSDRLDPGVRARLESWALHEPGLSADLRTALALIDRLSGRGA